MPNSYFQFKNFTIYQDKCSMKVSTDACVFGALIEMNSNVRRVLDMGTGTGLLSLMLAQKYEQIHIDAIEIDRGAYEQAQINVIQSPYTNSITVIHADIKQYNTTQLYDSIVCNPPFYENSLKSPNLKKNLAWHSDELLLADLISNAQRLLINNGSIHVLLPFFRLTELSKIAQYNGLFIARTVYIRKSMQHPLNRVVVTLQKAISTYSTIHYFIISDDKNNYTQQFKLLMHTFYIKM